MLSEISQKQKEWILYNSLYENPRAVKFIKTDSRILVARDWSERDGELMFIGYRISVLHERKYSGNWLQKSQSCDSQRHQFSGTELWTQDQEGAGNRGWHGVRGWLYNEIMIIVLLVAFLLCLHGRQLSEWQQICISLGHFRQKINDTLRIALLVHRGTWA